MNLRFSLSVENERAGAGRDGENSIENECGEWDGTGREGTVHDEPECGEMSGLARDGTVKTG